MIKSLLILALLFAPIVSYADGEKQNDEKRMASPSRWKGERISFDFKDMDLKEFFRFIADFSGNNIILDSGVKGTVTMKMKDVPWDQAMDVVCRTYGLGYQVEGKIYQVKK